MAALSARSFSMDDLNRIASLSERLPEQLCRYMTISGKRKRRQFAELLRKSELFFSPFSSFNDPYDGQVDYDFTGSEEEVREYWEDYAQELRAEGQTVDQGRIDDLVPNFNDMVRHRVMAADVATAISGYGVCCLAARPDDIPMWSYYGASHEGVCLRFSTAGFVRLWRSSEVLLLPVDYCVSYPVVEFYRTGLFDRVYATIATKAKVWEHEGEWRMVSPNRVGLVPFDPPTLEAVVLGCRISAEDEAFVRRCVTNHSVQTQLLRAVPKEHEYALDVQPIV
jgi:hypothetical protein